MREVFKNNFHHLFYLKTDVFIPKFIAFCVLANLNFNVLSFQH